MEAAMSSIATGPPGKMRVDQVWRTGSMRVLHENEKKSVVGWCSSVARVWVWGMSRPQLWRSGWDEDGRGWRLSQQGLGS